MAPLAVDPLSYPKAHHSGGHCPMTPMAMTHWYESWTAEQWLQDWVRASESEVLDAVLDAAARGGWLAAHHPNSGAVRGDPGLPDVQLVHPARGVLFVECKSWYGRLSLEQERWRDAIVSGGAAGYYTADPDNLRFITWFLAESDAKAEVLGPLLPVPEPYVLPTGSPSARVDAPLLWDDLTDDFWLDSRP